MAYYAFSNSRVSTPDVGAYRSYILKSAFPEDIYLVGFKNDSDFRVWFTLRFWFYFVRKSGIPFGEFIFDFFLTFQAYLLTRKGDFTHFYNPNSCSWLLKITGRKIIHEGYPILLDVLNASTSWFNFAGIRQIYAYRNSNLIVCPSVFVHSMMSARGLGKNSRILPYPLIVDKKKLSYIKPETLKIAFVGNLTMNKGFGLFLSAIKRLDKDICDDMQFHVYGKNRGSFDVDKFNIFYHGFIESKNASYLDAVDIVCLPSFHEGCSKVILESISKGKLVIISKNTGIDITLSNVFLLNELTSISLAEKIMEVSKIQELNIDLNKFYKHYSIDDFKDFWINELSLRK